MDNRYYLVESLEGFSDSEKKVYKSVLEEFEKYIKDENGEYIYLGNNVEWIDDKVLQNVANKLYMNIAEVDSIYLEIERKIYRNK